MNWAPLLAAPFAIRLHVAAAAIAALVTVLQLTLRRAGARHRLIGWIGVVAYAVTAISSFWIATIFTPYWSPIHLLSLLTLAALASAVRARRRGDIARHKRAMMGAATGLLLAGLFTLLPGRLMHALFLG